MKVHVTINPRAVQSLSKAQAIAVSQTASQLLKDARNSHVIPFDDGTLQNESSFVDDSNATKGIVSIVHDTPYARRLYFNPQYNFNQSKNPNARGEWWEDWITGHMRNRPHELFAQLYARAARRYVK